jgi:type IV pilus assembly protein PilB
MERKKKLGELFVESGMVTQRQIKEALELQERTGNINRIGETLIQLGYITRQQLSEILEFYYNTSIVDLPRITIPAEMASQIPISIARYNKVVPVKVEDGKLYIAMEDPYNILAIEDVGMVAKKEIVPLLAFENDINDAIDALYGNIHAEEAIEDFKKENDLYAVAESIQSAHEGDVGGAPIVRLINSIFEQAVRDSASDIHIEPMEKEVRIRLRIDGALSTVLSIPLNAHAAIITRIKILGNLNIAEKRIPQDGRYEFDIMNHNIDVRISTMPTVYGEKAVLRLLDRSSFLIEKSKLGFTTANLLKFDELLKNPHGIILVTGPTGSGKSTTLYTMLNELNNDHDNIITIEDPVEYMINGLNQVQVNPKAGLDFSVGLRAILRQDPDIVMVGEIRDQETVEIAIRAAITGHLVLSTLHTNDAVGTITRLIDMGVAPYMLADSLVGIIAQRLVRKICPYCKQEYTPDPIELASLGLDSSPDKKFYYGTGCPYCANTGYKGRIAVHEVLTITRKHREMIHNNLTADEIRDYSIKNGMTTLPQECVRLVEEGVTSIAEAISVAYSKD